MDIDALRVLLQSPHPVTGDWRQTTSAALADVRSEDISWAEENGLGRVRTANVQEARK